MSGTLALWGLGAGANEQGAIAFTADSSWRPVTVEYTPSVAGKTLFRVQVYIGTVGVNLDIDTVTLMAPDRIVDRVNTATEWLDPDNQLGGLPHQLWLREITRTGNPNGSAPLTTPPIRFETWHYLDNRADAMYMGYYRLSQMTDEIGGRIDITYQDLNPTDPNDMTPPCVQPSNWAVNTQFCYPRWTVVGASSGYGQCSRYPVVAVTNTDLVGGSPPVTTTYEYLGAPAYHYDDSPFLVANTWSLARGHGEVRVTTGPGQDGTYSRSRHFFFRGMNGDPNGNGTFKTVNLTYSDGSLQPDDPWLNGRIQKVEVYDGATMITRDESWFTGVVTGSLFGYTVRTDPTRTRHSSRESFVGGGDHISELHTFYDEYGMPNKVWDAGNIYDVTDDTCTAMQYARNVDAVNYWVDDRVTRVMRAAGQNNHGAGWSWCDESAAAELGFVENFYDGLGYGLSTGVGFVTQTRTRASAGAAWATTTVQPDGYNRPLTVDGPLAGSTDTTALYYDAAGLGTGERDGTGHTVTRDIDPGRGLARSVRDRNNGSLLVPATDGSDKVTYPARTVAGWYRSPSTTGAGCRSSR